MKKILSILLAMCMLFAMFALPAAAAEEVTCILHIGDTTQKISGAVGDVIKFPMPFSEAAAMGKHFVTWCTDEACEKPLTEDVKFTSGETVHYYAWLKDFATYYREDFDNVKNGDTVIQYAHDQSGAENYYGYTMPLYNSAVTPGTGVAISKASGWYEQHIFLKDSDGTYVTAAPNTTYRMEIKYRVTEVGANGGKIAIYPVYGLNTQYVGLTHMNQQHSVNKTASSAIATLTAVTDDWITDEVDFTTGDVLKDGFNKWVPNIGFRLFNSSGSTTTEIDYIEIQKYINVKFEFLYTGNVTKSLFKGDTIEYPALVGDTKWSLSSTEYIPVPEVVGNDNITVYEFSEDVDGTKYTATFIDGDSEKTFSGIEGAFIQCPVINASRNYDAVWSLSETEYVPVPKTFGAEDITAYRFNNPVISFENYPDIIYLNAAVDVSVTDEMAYTGNKSLKWTGTGYGLLKSKPANWNTNYTDYYIYENGEYVNITGDSAPTFEVNKYYRYRPHLRESSIALPAGSPGGQYKISFKYYVANTLEKQVRLVPYTCGSDIWAGTYEEYANSSLYINTTSKTGEWLNAEIFVNIPSYVVSTNAYLYLFFYNGALEGDDVIYFDDIEVDSLNAAFFDTGATSVILFDYDGSSSGSRYTVYFPDGEEVTPPTVRAPSSKVIDKWYSDAEFTTEATSFEIGGTYYLRTFERGDCDLNGAVDVDDLAVLKLALAGVYEKELNDAADITADGVRDIDDLAELKLVLSGIRPAATPLKVLGIGNSFTEDGTEYLQQVGASLGHEDFLVARAVIGGSSLDMHWSNMQNDSGAYTYIVNRDGNWDDEANRKDAKLSYVLNDMDWDVIVIQQVSNYSGLPNTYSNLQNIIDYIKSRCPDAKIMWQMTWAYQGDSGHSGFANYENDQMTMYNAIVSTTQQKILTNSDIVGIIPTGTAIQNLRTSYGDSITRDGYHLSYDYGRYTAAICWYAAITGRSIDEIFWMPGSYTYMEEHLSEIIDSVNAAISEPFEVTQIEY